MLQLDRRPSATGCFAALPPADFAGLAPALAPAELSFKQVLQAPDKPIRHVQFLESGMASMLAPLEEGQAVQIRPREPGQAARPARRCERAHIGVHYVHHLAAWNPSYRLGEVLRDHPELRGSTV